MAAAAAVQAIQFEGHAVMVACTDTISLWDARAGCCHREIAVEGLSSMQFCESFIVTGHLDGGLRWWDLRSGHMTNQHELAGGAVQSLCFDDSFLTCACDGRGHTKGYVAAFKMAMGFPLHLHNLELKGNPTSVAMDVSKIGRVYIGCDSGVVCRWDVPPFKRV